MKTFHPVIAKNENWFVIGFIAVSTLIMLILGNPATLLVIAGAFNGLILPITLAVCLIVAKKKSVMGPDYRHPWVLWCLGWIVVAVSAYLGVTTFISNVGKFSDLSCNCAASALVLRFSFSVKNGRCFDEKT